MGEIEIICQRVSDALEKLKNNRDGLPAKDVHKILEGFFNDRLDALNLINRLDNKVDVLLEMLDCFINSQKCDVSSRLVSTGCEADLNELRCKLDEFFKVVNKAGDQSKIDLQGIVNRCNELRKLSRNFSDKHHLACASETSCRHNDLICVNELAEKFETLLREAQTYLKDISTICENLSNAIDEWQNKLNPVK